MSIEKIETLSQNNENPASNLQDFFEIQLTPENIADHLIEKRKELRGEYKMPHRSGVMACEKDSEEYFEKLGIYHDQLIEISKNNKNQNHLL